MEAKKAEIAEYTETVAGLRSELDESRSECEEGKKLQGEQASEIEKLKAALAEEEANVASEREAKQEAIEKGYVSRGCIGVGR